MMTIALNRLNIFFELQKADWSLDGNFPVFVWFSLFCFGFFLNFFYVFLDTFWIFLFFPSFFLSLIDFSPFFAILLRVFFVFFLWFVEFVLRLVEILWVFSEFLNLFETFPDFFGIIYLLMAFKSTFFIFFGFILPISGPCFGPLFFYHFSIFSFFRSNSVVML